MRGGSVQEEILFAIEPEATVAMFFMEVMHQNDAIGIFNIIRYSNYKGYGKSFKYEESAIPEDQDKIKKHRIIAIDAIPTYKTKGLIDQKDIMRDIHKAYVGFDLINFENEVKPQETKKNEKSEKDKGKEKEKDKGKEKEKEKEKETGKGKEKEKEKIKEKKKEKEKGKDKEKNVSCGTKKAIEKTISTGNWGCGVFGGNHALKFIQQWIAASFAGVKRLDYYTFEKDEMKIVIQRLGEIKNKYKKANDLYNVIVYNQITDNNIIDEILKNDINK